MWRGGNSVSAHRVEKNATSQGMPKLNHSGDRHPQPGGKKEGTVNQLEFQPSPRVANSSCDSRRRLKYQADCKQYRNYYECEYCPLKSKDRSPLFFQVHRAQSHLQVIHVNLKKQSTSSKQMLVTYKETICWLHMSYLPTWLDVKYCTDISDHRRAVNGEPPND